MESLELVMDGFVIPREGQEFIVSWDMAKVLTQIIAANIFIMNFKEFVDVEGFSQK